MTLGELIIEERGKITGQRVLDVIMLMPKFDLIGVNDFSSIFWHRIFYHW
jgi:hypothetical protein